MTGTMNELDKLSNRFASQLDGIYDCVDRTVLNAYFQLGQRPGGFRMWWRSLKGSDEDLDKAHLMRMAGRFARRLRAHAKAHQIPVIDCQARERKHEVAERYLPDEPDDVGVFAILVGRAPAPVWDVKRTKSGKIANIERKTSYVNHYHFQIMDPDWGHIVIRMSGHPPFGAQVILNGHDYVARQARREGLAFQKEDNCFTDVTDADQLFQIADTLRSEDAVGLLEQVCDRWIYSACLCFALNLEEQSQTKFRYQYSVYQAEYSRNLLFQHGNQMEQLFQGIVDRTRSWLDVGRIKTIFGYKRRPYYQDKRRKPPRFEVVVEKPQYNLTIFKLHFGRLTVKMYTKGERVLRAEAVVHNTKVLRCGRSLPKFPQIVTELRQILQRFLDALDCMDHAFISDDSLDEISHPGYLGQSRVAGIDLNKPRLQAVIQAVIALSSTPTGFVVSMLAAKVREILGVKTYSSRQAAYDLRKLRAKLWVHRIAGSRKYQPTDQGLRTMTALLVLPNKVIKPLLAGSQLSHQLSKPHRNSPIDALYQSLQADMANLFLLLGIDVQFV
jgi:hypothetical protein